MAGSFGMVFEPTVPRLKDGVMSYLYFASRTRLAARRWRLTFDPTYYFVLSPVAVGDRFGLPLRLSYGLVFW